MNEKYKKGRAMELFKDKSILLVGDKLHSSPICSILKDLSPSLFNISDQSFSFPVLSKGFSPLVILSAKEDPWAYQWFEMNRPTELTPWILLYDPEKLEALSTWGKKGPWGYLPFNSDRVLILSLLESMEHRLILEKEKAESEQKAKDRELHLLKTFQSIGDGVIATDAEGLITRINPAAQRLCGYEEAEALGLPLERIFQIHNVLTGEKVQNPVEKVIQKGEVVGLANHTVLTSKAGYQYHIADSAAPIMNDHGQLLGVILVFSDVSESYDLQKKIRHREEQFQLLFGSMLEGFALHEIICNSEGEPVDYRYLMLNPAFEKLTGLTRELCLGRTIKEIVPETENYWIENFGKVALTGEPMVYENYSQAFNKHYHVVVFSPEKMKFAVIFTDITEQKESEMKITELYEQNQIILKESHHRIKNNMNTICGLLSVQAQEHPDTPCQIVLMDAVSRVQTMMVLYDKLYRSENFSCLNAKDYLLPLVEDIMRLFPNVPRIQTTIQIQDSTMEAKTLSTLGIIVNELFNNSQKYAFSNTGEGAIILTLRQHSDHIVLLYRDDGKTFPSEKALELSQGFGLKLITMLVEQMMGEMQILRDEGTQFTIKIPLSQC